MSVSTREDARDAIGQLLVGRYRGRGAGPELAELLRRRQCRAVIEFADNVEHPLQLNEEHRRLWELGHGGVLFCVDQEGGRVQRIKAPATLLPPMATLAAGGPEAVRQAGATLGRELRAIGYHFDFAPVVDVWSNPTNTVIGDRAFGTDSALVASLAPALIAGLQGEGVAACAKHFPGHGDTALDSHQALPIVRHELARLRALEWPPFKAAIAAGVASVMTAHVVVEALDPRPATLAPLVLAHLRDELGFDGPIVSDDLTMGALAALPLEERVLQAALAGCDLLLICSDPEDCDRAYRALVLAEERGVLTRQRLGQAAARLERLWSRYVRPVPRPAGPLFSTGRVEV